MGDVAGDESDWEFGSDWEFEIDPTECARRIKANDPSYTAVEIYPYGPTPTLSSWLELGRDLGRNTEMKKLHICADGNHQGDDITNTENLRVFFRDGLSFNRSLKSLQLQEIHCDDADNSRTHIWFEAIYPLVQENHNLFDLRLYSCDLSVNDIAGLTAALSLRGDGSAPMKRIDIAENPIRDEMVRAIVELAETCPQLKRLAVGNNGLGTSQCCTELAYLLENANSVIRRLDLESNAIDDSGVQVLADAVGRNHTLLRLSLNGCRSITARGWDHMLRVLCNTTSIDATLGSNHTLERLEDGTREEQRRMKLPEDVLFCLDTNQQSNKSWVAKQKILRFHFSGDFSLAPFREMELELLPSVLGWVSVEDWYPTAVRVSAVYRILKNFPDLCNFPSYERRMRLQVEAENALLRGQIERLQAEIEEMRSNKRLRKD